MMRLVSENEQTPPRSSPYRVHFPELRSQLADTLLLPSRGGLGGRSNPSHRGWRH